MRLSRRSRWIFGLLLVVQTVFALGMVVPETLGDSDWIEQASFSVTDIDAIQFVDETVGFAVDGTSKVWRTTDGGRSWDYVSVTGIFEIGSGATLHDIHFTDASTGWAVGRHWASMPTVSVTAEVEPELVITVYSEAIYKTDDGGATWTRQARVSSPSGSALRAVHFYDESNGFVVGDGGLAASTADGGTTWTAHYSASADVDLNDVYMTSPTSAFIVGDSGAVGRWSPLIVIPMEDVAPSAIWTYSPQASGTVANLTAVAFTDRNTGSITSAGTELLHTVNAGATWVIDEWAPGFFSDISFADLSFTDANNGWAVGVSTFISMDPEGTILKTTDGGATWGLGDWTGRDTLTCVSAVSDSCAWVGGYAGIVSKYGATNTDQIAGTNRYDTAIQTSQDSFADNSCDVVVIATGSNFPDALSAAGLAGAYECPLLLTSSVVTSDLTDEIDRVGATTVVLIGGTGAISGDVELALQGSYSVDRIAGENRYDTAAKVAARIATVMDAGTGFNSSVFVARGDNFADALAISPFAYSQQSPVLLVRTDSVPSETATALRTLNIQAATLAGGTGAISAATMTDIDDIIVTENGGMNSDRWAGANRYETAAVIAGHGVDAGFADASYIGVATGLNFPDALGGGVACGRRGGVLLLTSPTALSAPAETFIVDRQQYDTSVRIFGGVGAVAPAVRSAIEALF